MADLTPSARQIQQGRPELLGIQASRVLALPEAEYRRWVLDLERDPLFAFLNRPPKGQPRILRRRPWPHTRMAFSELTADLAERPAAAPTPDPPSELRGTLKRIGQDAFEKYFLHNDEDHAVEEIAAACGVTPADVARVRAFVDEWDIGAGPASAAPEPSSPGYDAVATFEAEDGKIGIAFRSSHYARGLYVIDYDQLRRLRTRAGDLPGSWAEVRKLVGALELANRKQTVLAGVLETIAAEQKRYVLEGHIADLKPLRQREAAARLGVTASAVSRALGGRSARVPWGREIPLREFFPTRKQIMLHFVRAELERKPNLTDAELHGILRRDRGLTVSVRSVNMYRHRVKKRATKDGQ